MFYPQTGYEGLSAWRSEEEDLALRQDCQEDMEATITRLRTIVIHAPMSEVERQIVLYQLTHILQHLRESVNLLLAEKQLRHN